MRAGAVAAATLAVDVPDAPSHLKLAGEDVITLDRPRIMGILNVTPDSFSDGGRWADPSAAVERGLKMVEQGADLIDVGGESTRPGAQRVPEDEQVRRVSGVVGALTRALDRAKRDVPISIDTTRAAVAEAALEQGARLVNDVSAGRDDASMIPMAARRGAPIVLMHMLGAPRTMQDDPQYADVLAEVMRFLAERAAGAIEAGVDPGRIMVDPGIGFGKTRAHNLALLAGLDRIAGLGFPVLLGASRKRFMGAICSDASGNPPRPDELVGATCATTALGVAAGVRMFRVHDVRANRQAADVAEQVARSR
ncbi:MAG: dihydropteroate synthase [Phycisphaeraceae bacterium]|nr:dihydropteroate synthase [Phycisphaeraceae bacterium]